MVRRIKKFYPQYVRNVMDKNMRRIVETEYLIDKKFAKELSTCKTMKVLQQMRAKKYNKVSSLGSSLGDL